MPHEVPNKIEQPQEDSLLVETSQAVDKEKTPQTEKVDRLKGLIDEGIKAAHARMQSHEQVYGSRWLKEMGTKIQELGAEAPKSMTENYEFQKSKIEHSERLVKELTKLKELVDLGITYIPPGYSMEKKIEELMKKFL